jgi:ATP-dependent DNA ligase
VRAISYHGENKANWLFLAGITISDMRRLAPGGIDEKICARMRLCNSTMLYAFSLPTKSDKVPAGPNWLHEIKYDGYRMMVIREHNTRSGRPTVVARGRARTCVN